MLGNIGDLHALPVLQNALNDEEPMIREHAQWAIEVKKEFRNPIGDPLDTLGYLGKNI